MELLSKLNRTGKTVILVTHDNQTARVMPPEKCLSCRWQYPVTIMSVPYIASLTETITNALKAVIAFKARTIFIKKLQKTKEGIPKPFKYTTEPMEEENVAKMRQRDKEKLWEIYARIYKSPNEELPKLFNLKEKYPNVPSIYNYIAVAYAYNGQKENYFNFIIETVNKFPDYLFGKISLAEYYINKGEYKKVPKVLNNKFEIHMHYDSSVKIFHFSEVRGFYSLVGRYYVKANKINRVQLLSSTIVIIE